VTSEEAEIFNTILSALKATTSTYRTFRNVPLKEQEWTSLDDEALDGAFDAICIANIFIRRNEINRQWRIQCQIHL